MWGHRSSSRHPTPSYVDLAYSEGCLDSGALEVFVQKLVIPLAVQHLTASAEDGRQGQFMQLRKKLQNRSLELLIVIIIVGGTGKKV